MHKKILFFIVLFFLLTGCAGRKQSANLAPPNSNMLTGKKILMVVAPKDFRDVEYNEPRKIFDRSGAAVKVASIQHGRSVGAEGTMVNIDLTVSEVGVDDYDAVVFIGGPGMARIVGDDSLQMLAKRFYGAGKLTAAICVSPSILAGAGILRGRRVTAWSGVKDDLVDSGAVFTDKPVVADGNIITGSGPQAAQAFGEAVVDYLENVSDRT